MPNEKQTEKKEEQTKEVENKVLFSDLGLTKDILKVVEEQGYKSPTPIQEETIPYILSGRDVLGQAQTGTGKTAAFALPTLSMVDEKSKVTQVLVLAPTRELAIQVSESYKTYSKYHKGINVCSIYGGQDYSIQFKALKKGAHVVVGTPGRVIDHIRKGTLKLDKVKTIVLDEADEMLRMGFIDDVEFVLDKMPKERQITLFSATMPSVIRKITRNYQSDPVEIKIKTQTETANNINQQFLVVNAGQKKTALSRILEIEETDAAIIFTKTKSATVEITDFLSDLGFRTVAINGDLQQKQRERAIEQLKSHKLDVLVATDVAARGLDVSRISHVINYDIPYDTETYIHRIGRTGRAGRSGSAILLITPKERRRLGQIERVTKKEIKEFKIPSIDAINEKRISKFKERITKVLAGKDNSIFVKAIEEYCNDNDADPIIVAAALAKITQGKKPMLLTKADELKAASGRGERGSNNSRGRDDSRGRNSRGNSRGKPLARSEMELYRIEVGEKDNVKPGNIVGAIANEAGLDGNMIGQIDIYSSYSTVFLPKGMPKDVFNDLRKARIAGKKSEISLTKGKPSKSSSNYSSKQNDRSQDKPKRRRKRKSAKKD